MFSLIEAPSGGGLPGVVYTIGYEPTDDASPATRWHNSPIGGFLYHSSWKIYPWAVGERPLSIGVTFHCIVFKEYKSAKEIKCE